jgi:hypothetical protein
MYKQLIKHPAYIFKFAIYCLFICFAGIFYFTPSISGVDGNVRTLYAVLLLVYGLYRMIRTYQDFKTDIRAVHNETDLQ